MKFSWRANWEILLVLVIIVVGIVITTIAAIRNNRDKNPLVLTDEADFGQLLAGSGSGAFIETPATARPTDSNNQAAADAGRESPLGLNDDEEPATRRPLLQAMLKTSRPSSSFHPVVREQQTGSRHLTATGGFSGHHDGRQSKYESSNLSEYNRLVNSLGDQQWQPTGGPAAGAGSLDSYDTMSTEPTPSQVNQFTGQPPASNQGHMDVARFHNGSRRAHFNRSSSGGGAKLADGAGQLGGMNFGDQMSESVDLIDDIHTTRSSLANESPLNQASNNNQQQQHYTGNPAASPATSGLLGPQSLDQMPMTPSLALYAPYGVTQASLNQLMSSHNYNSASNQHKALEHQPPVVLDSEDMVTSYTKIPSVNTNSSGSGSLSEAILRDYNLATAFANATSASNQQQSQHLINSAMLANLMGSMQAHGGDGSIPPPATDPFAKVSPSLTTHHRSAFSASSPLSVLLGDLLKLTRPHQQQLLNSSANSSNDQTPTGGRLHAHSILQQLRSLPGPLMALLQGLSPAGGSSSSNNGDLASLTNHDASESSQHYHRVSMSPTDIHSILARSLSGPGVLPAFPAPSGVQQSWVPPTSGGSANYHAAQNSNADFVASNAAGFVRATNKPAQQQPTAANGQQSGSNEINTYQYAQQQQSQQQHHQQPQRQDPSSFGQSSDNSNAQQPTSMNTNQQHQQQNIYGNHLVQGKPDKQSAIFPTNHSPGNQLDGRPWVQQQQQHQSGPFVGQNGGGRQNPEVVGSQDVAGAAAARRASHKMSSNIMGQAGGAKNGIPDYAAYLSFQQSVLDQANQQFNAMRAASQAMPEPPYNHAPVYNSRLVSEMQVPLGYSPQLTRSAPSSAFEFNGAAVESAPKVSISAGSSQGANIRAASAASGIGQQQVASGSHQSKQSANSQQKSLTRRRRSTSLAGGHNAMMPQAEEGRVDEIMSSRYSSSGEDDDDSDSQPISVVRPDGQPTNSGRVRGFAIEGDGQNGAAAEHGPDLASGDRQVAQSQRTANHLKQDLDHHHHYPSEHYMSLYNRQGNRQQRPRAGSHNELDVVRSSGGSRDFKEAKRAFGGLKKNKKQVHIETAGSGLMSKLLGTASTNEETEEDADDDSEANEKIKDDMEDAEFGIANDERQLRPAAGRDSGAGATGSRPADVLNSVDGGGGGRSDENSGNNLGPSGTNDNEAYARRNQQRSDIEFYGHPGEETRTLKYGILGSGNYEVVNGGIYPEADESTAAVNSVANYVRKPGSLLGGLPKLLADHSQSGPQSSYMAGSRLGGFMRDASANPDDLVGLVPAGPIGKDPMGSPMLELIDANGAQLFDPSMLAHLGSSTRTTHTSRDTFEPHDGFGQGLDLPAARASTRQGGQSAGFSGPQDSKASTSSASKARKGNSNRKKANKFKQSSPAHGEFDSEDEGISSSSSSLDDADNPAGGGNPLQQMQQQQSSITGSRSHGTNQFNSYQILPSKKVTIFSDQDLDSAPSELGESRIFGFQMR